MIDDPIAQQRLVDPTSPADRWVAITPNDAADLAEKPRALYCNGEGNLVLRGADGTDVTFTVTASQIVPFSPHRVLSTGTTATGIVGLY